MQPTATLPFLLSDVALLYNSPMASSALSSRYQYDQPISDVSCSMVPLIRNRKNLIMHIVTILRLIMVYNLVYSMYINKVNEHVSPTVLYGVRIYYDVISYSNLIIGILITTARLSSSKFTDYRPTGKIECYNTIQQS